MKKILIISAFLFLCSSTVFCEYFYLKSGEEIKGRIISETTSTVKISLAGSGEKRVLKIKDIFEISVKKKAVAPKPVETYGVEYAKTAFTSENQTAVGDSKEYVTDNSSGVLIYSLKETEPQGKTAASNDNEFDAAAYLLGESSSKSKSSQTQTNNASKPSKPQIPVSNDEDFDAAAYLLGDTPSKSKSSKTQDKPEPKPSKPHPPVSNDEDFDAAAYLLGDTPSKSKSSKTQDKPEPKPSKPQPSVSNDEDFDAAAYLLGDTPSKSKSSKTQDKPEPKPSKSKSSASNDEDFDAAAYLLGQQANQDSAKSKAISNENEYETLKYRIKDYSAYDGYYEDKPDNETLLAVSFDLKGSINFDGTVVKEGLPMELSGQSDYGVSVSFEHYAYLTRLFALGLGLEYNFQRYLNETGRYSFLPIFVSAKMRIISGETYHIYAAARLGYGIFMANSSYWLGDTRGGFYGAAGIGVSYHRFTLQCLYSYDTAKVNHKVAADEFDADISFSKLGIYFGYLF